MTDSFEDQLIAFIEGGRFTLHELLGEGSYGEGECASSICANFTNSHHELLVFLVEENETGDPYAMKVMDISSTCKFANYIKERYFSTILNTHKNVLQAIDTFVINTTKDIEYNPYVHSGCVTIPSEPIPENDRAYGVMVLDQMDFDLMDYIISKERMEEEEARFVFREICKGLKHMHDNKVVHLDLKPDNILIGINDPIIKKISAVKICDFGFALEVDVTKRMISQVSGCSIRFGTKQYQPPETTIQNGPFPFTLENIYKVDIWSLGVILFIMLSGVFPFAEDDGHIIYIGINEIERYLYNENPSMKFMKYEETPMHLIGTIFNHDPNKRPTIEKVLAHPWLNMKQKVKKANKFLPFNKCYLLEKLNGTLSDVSDAEYMEIFDEKKKHDKRVEEKRKKKEEKEEKKEKRNIPEKIYDAYLNLVSKKV